MDAFMNHVLEALNKHGAKAINIFPKEAGVLLNFADRLASDVVRW
jgi:recyclin-1